MYTKHGKTNPLKKRLYNSVLEFVIEKRDAKIRLQIHAKGSVEHRIEFRE